MQTEQGNTINFEEVEYHHFKCGTIFENLDRLIETTHNLEQLLDTFFFETQSWLSSDGMSFSNEPRRINYEVGSRSRNRCHYRLFCGVNYLGELSFSRATRFSLEELELVEELLAVLSSPLQVAVVHK